MPKQFINDLEKYINHRIDVERQANWLLNARDSQLPPVGQWKTWLILAGRGFGKTRTGAETLAHWLKNGQYKRVALIGKSAREVETVMLGGESGLLPRLQGLVKKTSRSEKSIQLHNGAIITTISGDCPEQLRGPQFDLAWIDELAKYRNPEELWNQLMMTLRLSKQPRCIITTTPKPIPLIQKLLQDDSVVVTRGSTFENKKNLPDSYINLMHKQFAGTKLGAQELYAQVLTDQEGALWTRDMIIYKEPEETDDGQFKLDRIVIAIDPATTHHDDSDETGIVVAGLHGDQAYLLEDLSGRHSPASWGKLVCDAYYKWQADRVIAEINKGGDLVERVVKSQDSTLSFKAVRATRGKHTRAEPISALYEQKRIFHIRPFQELERQICHYIPGKTSKSPDRMDALVWAMTELFLVAENKPQMKLWSV